MSIRRRMQYQHRLERSRENSSSSSMAEDTRQEEQQRSISASSNHSNQAENSRPRRRRRRKRTLTSSDGGSSTTATSLRRQKVLSIEKALLYLEDGLSESSNDEETSPRPEYRGAGRKRLKDLAVSEYGLVTDDLRKKVWPRLLNIDLVETSVSLADEEVEANKNYHQVLMDVNRSLKRFPPGISDEVRPELQDQLTRLIIRVLAKHPDLHYYQGYHDVAITFLLVVGEEMAFHILEKLSNGPWLREFMYPTMENTTFLLNFMYPIIEAVDPDLHDFLDQSEVGTIFGLPWLITWFGHVLPDYNDVVRLYDFFLAQPPMMAVYLAAAIVLHRSADVKRVDCDMASVHGLLSRIPLESPPFERLLRRANDLYELYPPKTIEEAVHQRLERTHEEPIRKAVVTSSSMVPKRSPSRSLLKGIVLLATPVVIGVFLYRFVQNNYI